MAGVITALKVQKRNKERINVFLKETYAFSVSMPVAIGLKKGQYLSDSDIEQLKNQDARAKAYNQAIRFLSFRWRSQMEIERHLRGKGYPPDVIAETVERLQHEKYLDDEAFARFWLADRERFRPRGQQALTYELKQKGIAAEVIETVLADLDESELAWAAVEPKLFRWKNLDAEDFKKKIMGFLSRRGFDYEVAQAVFKRASAALNSLEADENL